MFRLIFGLGSPFKFMLILMCAIPIQILNFPIFGLILFE